MWSIGEIKKQGKMAFKANYWKSVIVAFVSTLLIGGTSTASSNTVKSKLSNVTITLTPTELLTILIALLASLFIISVVSILLQIFVFNPLNVGCHNFFKENVKTNSADLSEITLGFKNYGKTFVTLFLRDLFIFLWSLLFIIPGLIKSYSYRMVPYIIADEPELSSSEVISRSREMMNGHKFHTFLYDLSFIGWIILSCITAGIVGIFWVNPYILNSNAALYLELKNK